MSVENDEVTNLWAYPKTNTPHVDPHKIETFFRAFPKFKLINATHLYLTQRGVG